MPIGIKATTEELANHRFTSTCVNNDQCYKIPSSNLTCSTGYELCQTSDGNDTSDGTDIYSLCQKTSTE